MDIKSYIDVSQKASNIAAQQKIAEGIQDNVFGNSDGMLFEMNFAQNLGTHIESKSTMSFNQQVKTLKKLKDLLDSGILIQTKSLLIQISLF